jgi:hypothetical protein
MTTYNAKIAAWQKYGVAAIGKLMEGYGELCLSLPEEKVIAEALVSKTKLGAEVPISEDTAYSLLEKFFAELIQDGKLKFADFGLSTAGREELAHLAGLLSPSTRSVTTQPVDDFADVVSIYRGPSEILNRKIKNPEFKARFDAAISAGLI